MTKGAFRAVNGGVLPFAHGHFIHTFWASVGGLFLLLHTCAQGKQRSLRSTRFKARAERQGRGTASSPSPSCAGLLNRAPYRRRSRESAIASRRSRELEQRNNGRRVLQKAEARRSARGRGGATAPAPPSAVPVL